MHSTLTYPPKFPTSITPFLIPTSKFPCLPSIPTSSFTPFLQHPPLGLGQKPHFPCSAVTEEISETSDGHLKFIEIGYISDVHGLQGEIHVKHNTDFPDLRFAKPGKRWLRQQISGRQNVLEVELLGRRSHPGDKSWIVKLSSFDSIYQVLNYMLIVGAAFLVRESDRPELEEGEFYNRDLVGMRVILKAEYQASVPVVFISPAHIVHPLEELFSSHDYFDFNPEKVRFLEEEKLPVVNCSTMEESTDEISMAST